MRPAAMACQSRYFSQTQVTVHLPVAAAAAAVALVVGAGVVPAGSGGPAVAGLASSCA
jgi:hypothetical protein